MGQKGDCPYLPASLFMKTLNFQTGGVTVYVYKTGFPCQAGKWLISISREVDSQMDIRKRAPENFTKFYPYPNVNVERNFR